MSEAQANENTCVVCFKNVLYYSIGECDHPVCFECSTRMRVLCLQNECPICRKDLLRVVFTDSIHPYKELGNREYPDRLFERQYKIVFCSEDIKNAYENLLENRCKICDKIPPFRNFSLLNDHMRRVHERFFCDLCVNHLKIFTNERRCYTRQELAHHRRKGDLDDTSHRGHPLCEFCEKRFMDPDELYRHLRKEHLYCHLCDADGKNFYYASHSALAQHFRKDHYLCEEGECAGQHLTAVFRSEIDLKAHIATTHGRGMPRGAARQARTLELQFNITPHPVVTQRTPRDRGAPETPAPPSPPPVSVARLDTHSDQDFPRLSAAPPAQNLVLGAPLRNFTGGDRLTRNDKNFPALDGAGPSRAAPRPPAPATVAATILRNSKPSVSIQLHSQPASASNFRLTQTSGNRISIPPQQKKPTLDDDDFPSLSMGRDDHPNIGASSVQPPKVTMINSQEMQALKNNQTQSQPKKSQRSTEAFPALSATAHSPAAPPQWITVSKGKDKPRARAEPAPPPREQPAFNQVADFPTLPLNKSKSKPKNVIVIPQATPRPQPQHQQQPAEAKLTKKEKKKQNIKKENIAEIPLVNGLDKKYAKDPSFTEVNSNVERSVERDKKIKTIETTSSVTVNSDRNTGNGDFALAPTEYPPLNPKGNKETKDYPPLQTRAENVAFNRRVTNGSVPPGFKPRPACDGMTFTNSAGQTFSAPVHKYIPPPEFESRNRVLVKKFAVALGGAEAVESFKVASRAFRDSIISADEFYEHCRSALGSQLESVFPELVALLPDIGKQQELVVGKNVSELEVCATCGQLLSPGDRIAHDTAHWPPLAPR